MGPGIFATGHVVKEAPCSSLEILSSRRHMSSIKESPAPCMFPRALADRVENQAKKALEKFELGDKSDAETGQFALDEEVKSGENGSLTKSAIARENPIIITLIFRQTRKKYTVASICTYPELVCCGFR